MDKKVIQNINGQDIDAKVFMSENSTMFPFSYRIIIGSNTEIWKNEDGFSEKLASEKEFKKNLINQGCDYINESLKKSEKTKLLTQLFQMQSYSTDTIAKFLAEGFSLYQSVDDDRLKSYSIYLCNDIYYQKVKAYRLVEKTGLNQDNPTIGVERTISSIHELLMLLISDETVLKEKLVALKYLCKMLGISEVHELNKEIKEYIKKRFSISDRRYDGEYGIVFSKGFDDLSFIMNLKDLSDVGTKDIIDLKEVMSNYVTYSYGDGNPSIVLIGNGGYDKEVFNLLEMKYQIMNITPDLLKDYIGNQYTISFKINDDMMAYLKDGDYDETPYPIMKLFTLDPRKIWTIVNKDNTYYVLFQIKEKENVCYGISFPEQADGNRQLIQIEKPEDVNYTVTDNTENQVQEALDPFGPRVSLQNKTSENKASELSKLKETLKKDSEDLENLKNYYDIKESMFNRLKSDSTNSSKVVDRASDQLYTLRQRINDLDKKVSDTRYKIEKLEYQDYNKKK